MKAEPPTPLKLAIVICDFNGWDQTQKCLQSLAPSLDKSIRVYLVDHGTDGRTRQGVASHYSNFVQLITASPELWWSGATNLGIRAALDCGVERVMLLNNDCCFADGQLGRIVNYSLEHSDTVIAPIQIDADSGLVVSARPRACLLLGFNVLSASKGALTKGAAPSGLLATGLICGGRGVVIPAPVFRSIGLLDESRLPHYGADHDFYFRCRKAGIRMLIASDVSVKVDNTRTSLSKQQYGRGLAGLITALTSPRSHCNLQYHAELYRKHYPLPGMHYLGVTLFALRYIATFIVQDIRARLSRMGGGTTPVTRHHPSNK